MGIGISNWRLAREVARLGELGVVSGTAINSVLVRRLQSGDSDGSVRRALGAFPFPKMALRILEKYFVHGGVSEGKPFKRSPMYTIDTNTELDELTIAANFVEVYLAKEGHDGRVGINFLEKVQLPHLASIYGALLAGVDYILMGAGIPRDIPGVLDLLVQHQAASLKISVIGAETGAHKTQFDPLKIYEREGQTTLPLLKRPQFLPIVSSAVLAKSLATKSSGKVDGFIVELPTAGGHNAPPRGKMQLNEKGEPLYGERDEVNLADMRALGLPFWLAGSFGSPEKLQEALDHGAAGVQVGTAFAYAMESGLTTELKKEVLTRVTAGVNPQDMVFTDPLASPTGFPFKVVNQELTMSETSVYEQRPRKCDLGYLRDPVQLADGRMAYRCAAEPIEAYVKKGGVREETAGRKCLCNALMATTGLGQNQENGYVEQPLITSGDDLALLRRLATSNDLVYSAADVISLLRSHVQINKRPPLEAAATL